MSDNMISFFSQSESEIQDFDKLLSKIKEIVADVVADYEWPVGSVFIRRNDVEKIYYSFCAAEFQQFLHPMEGYPKVTAFLKLVPPNKKKMDVIRLEVGEKLFEKVNSPLDIECEKKTKRIKRKDGTAEITTYYKVSAHLSSCSLLAFIKDLVLVFMKDYRSSEPKFGCCDRYEQCSDAKKCLHPNRMFSTVCAYRQNLEQGRIFYGKNKNADRLWMFDKSVKEKVNMERYISIDFETANAQRVSACAVGVALIEDGAVTKRFSSLLKPPACDFAPINMKIHHITPEMVDEAPTFDEIYPQLKELAAGSPIIGYSKFDRSVLKSLKEYYGLPISSTRIDGYIDVCAEAKRTLPKLKNHKLKTLAEYFGLGDFKHHDPSDDAYICARVFLELNGVSLDRNPAVSQDELSFNADKASVSRAFNGFVDVILDDGRIDYKEAVELKYFLSVIPGSQRVRYLQNLIDSILEDGECDADESSLLESELRSSIGRLWD